MGTGVKPLRRSLSDFRGQRVAGLLGVPEEHGGVGLVEDGVVDGSVTNTQRSLHHDNLQRMKMYEYLIKNTKIF